MDLVISVFATLALTIWMFCFNGASTIDAALADDRATLYGTIATLLGALLGFIIAALAIFVAVVPHRRLARVRASSQYATIWRTLTSTMWWLALGTLLALTCLVFDRDAHPVRWLELTGAASWLIAASRLMWTMWIIQQAAKLLSSP